ncbi:MAG: ABC transporter ATP-binding protein [Acidimicrobiales bacterium]
MAMSKRHLGVSLGSSALSIVRGGRTILDRVDFHAETDQHWVIMGPNGSGKSTLLHALARQIRPTEGETYYREGDEEQRDARKIRQRVSILSQATMAKFVPQTSVRDVILTGATGALAPYWDVFDSTQRARAAELAQVVGVGHLLTHPYESISQGERQRVALARAVMSLPPVLILDELMSGMDLGGREDLHIALDDLVSRDEGPLVSLHVTHHVEEIPVFVTHMALIAEARIVAMGSVEEVLTEALLSEVFKRPIQLHRIGTRWVAVADHGATRVVFP